MAEISKQFECEYVYYNLDDNLFYQCNEEEFGCHSGSCVALTKRCNLIEDCDDGTDEKNCRIIEVDTEKYKKHDPPVTDGNKVIVNISTH